MQNDLLPPDADQDQENTPSGYYRRSSGMLHQLPSVIASKPTADYSAKVDIDTLVKELEQARLLAISNDEPSAAISATMGKAKLYGLLVDKSETTVKRPEDMTEKEILQELGFKTVEEFMASEGQLIEHQEGDETIN